MVESSNRRSSLELDDSHSIELGSLSLPDINQRASSNGRRVSIDSDSSTSTAEKTKSVRKVSLHDDDSKLVDEDSMPLPKKITNLTETLNKMVDNLGNPEGMNHAMEMYYEQTKLEAERKMAEAEQPGLKGWLKFSIALAALIVGILVLANKGGMLNGSVGDKVFLITGVIGLAYLAKRFKERWIEDERKLWMGNDVPLTGDDGNPKVIPIIGHFERAVFGSNYFVRSQRRKNWGEDAWSKNLNDLKEMFTSSDPKKIKEKAKYQTWIKNIVGYNFVQSKNGEPPKKPIQDILFDPEMYRRFKEFEVGDAVEGGNICKTFITNHLKEYYNLDPADPSKSSEDVGRFGGADWWTKFNKENEKDAKQLLDKYAQKQADLEKYIRMMKGSEPNTPDVHASTVSRSDPESLAASSANKPSTKPPSVAFETDNKRRRASGVSVHSGSNAEASVSASVAQAEQKADAASVTAQAITPPSQQQSAPHQNKPATSPPLATEADRKEAANQDKHRYLHFDRFNSVEFEPNRNYRLVITDDKAELLSSPEDPYGSAKITIENNTKRPIRILQENGKELFPPEKGIFKNPFKTLTKISFKINFDLTGRTDHTEASEVGL